MNWKRIFNSSIRSKLQRMTQASVLSYLLVALMLWFFFIRIDREIGLVVEEQLRQTMEVSTLSRELGDFFPRLQVLGNSFYGSGHDLDSEGEQLRELLTELKDHVKDRELTSLMTELRLRFNDFLQQARVVNGLFLDRKQLDVAMYQELEALEKIVTEKIISQAQQGYSTSYYEQLILLISGFRESLLEIMRLNAEENHSALLRAAPTDQPPLTDQLKSLSERLRTLISAEPPIDHSVGQLLDQVIQYQRVMKRYLQEMIKLGQNRQVLDKLITRIHQSLTQLNHRTGSVGNALRAEIRRLILVAGVVTLLLLTATALLIGISHLRLFRKQIQQPMDSIRRRLQQFQQGDISSPMPLDRQDEWGEIEAAFNEMVSSLVQSMNALQMSERRYRGIFDNASEGIYQSTIEGEFLAMNPAMASMLGYETPQQAVDAYYDLSQQLFLDSGDRDRLMKAVREQGVVMGREIRMRRKNGEIFWASVNVHVVLDNEGVQAFLEGTVNDVTAQRNAAETLRQLQQYLQSIIDSMPSILIGVDVNQQVTLWNQRVSEVTGTPASLAEGQHLTRVFPLLATDAYLPALNQVLEQHEPKRLSKVSFNQGEQQKYYDILIFPVSRTGMNGAVIYMEEITERVQVEEMMVQSEKMLSVGGLAAGMAHEINNPLAAVLQHAQVLSQRLSPLLDKNRKVAQELGVDIEQIDAYVEQRGINQSLQSLFNAGQRAARIVENMQLLSRKSTSNFLPHSLPNLLEQTLELAASDYDLKHHYDFRAIEIIRDYQAIPDVPCEAGQIQQVLLNLLKNAAHALKEIEQPQISLRIFAEKEQVCLQIEDNGPGMQEEVRRRVFEPFYSTKVVGTGPGLGLSVAYFIINENHRGKMSAQSEPGKGTCFTIHLPLQSSSRATTK